MVRVIQNKSDVTFVKYSKVFKLFITLSEINKKMNFLQLGFLLITNSVWIE